MPKLYCSIEQVSNRKDWYVAHLTLNGRQVLGFGVSHYEAFINALEDKSKY